MSNPEISSAATVAEQSIQTKALPNVAFSESRALGRGALPERRFDNRELAMDVEPIAEVIGKMPELSFQKHGGPDNSRMPQRL